MKNVMIREPKIEEQAFFLRAMQECNKLLFRDYLRLHPDIAKEYEQLKMKLAQEHLYDCEKYTDEKSDFVHKVLQLAKR